MTFAVAAELTAEVTFLQAAVRRAERVAFIAGCCRFMHGNVKKIWKQNRFEAIYSAEINKYSRVYVYTADSKQLLD